ncbi:transposase DDE domain-containing protein, partial [Escherichia coli 8.0566]
YQFC